MLKEFRDFINRGNVIDLAVAVVVGAAFTGIVNSFSTDILGGILAAIGGQPDLSSLTLTVGEGEIRYGSFLTAVINFIIVAFAVFLLVKALNATQERFKREKEAEEEAAPTEVELLTQIRDSLASRPPS